MAGNEEKESNSTKHQAGAGIFRNRTFPPEFIRAWHALNTQTARENLKRIALAHGVEADLEPALGMYLGDLEPSFVLSMSGELEHIKGAIAEWGKCHHQISLRIVYPDIKKGKGFRAIMNLPKPLSPHLLQDLVSILHNKRESATFISNEAGLVVGIEYWGTSQNERRYARRISRFVERVVGQEINPEYKDGYVVEDIDETSYDQFIKASTPKRRVMAKSCLKNYKFPS
jgi:hypothetical protein